MLLKAKNITIIFTVLLVSCVRDPIMPDNQELDSFRMPITGLSAVYSPETKHISLYWDTPAWNSSNESLFRVYRAVLPFGSDNNDVAIFESKGLQKAISADSLSDPADARRGLYIYKICAIKVNGADTVEGMLSEPESCIVGNRSYFTINNNSLFIDSKNCSLYLYDPEKKIESVRFSQKLLGVNLKGNVVPFEKPHSSNENSIIRTLQNAKIIKYVDSTRMYSSYFVDFEINDPLNLKRDFVITSDTTIIPWTLDNGIGEKIIYAEVKYKNQSGATALVDTLFDLINTMPHNIQLNLRNSSNYITRPLSASTSSGSKTPTYVLQQQFGLYSIRLFGDENLDKEFEYWAISRDSASDFNLDMLKNQNWWVSTRPKTALLGGSGVFHDEGRIENFSFDLSRPDDAFDTIFIGNQDLILETLAGDKISNAKRFRALNSSSFAMGYKEFYIMARFVDKAFRDTILTIIGYEGSALAHKTAFDIFPARANFKPIGNPDHMSNGSIIDRSFNFALFPSNLLDRVRTTSIQDDGGAEIVKVDLLVASMPSNWYPDMSYEEIIANSRSYHFTYPLPAPSARLYNIRWDNIDPSQWQSGNYVMGVVTTDKFGNQGFALPVSGVNPWTVEVRTAK